MKRVKIAPEPEQESAPLNPLNVDSLDDAQSVQSDRGERIADIAGGKSFYQSQFQLWDSHVIEDNPEEGDASTNGIQIARHPGWATFDKENLASMECFGGMLTRTLEPCPKKSRRVLISNDGTRVASFSLTDTRSEVIVYDTNRGKAICNHTCSGATPRCEFTDADNTLYLSSSTGMSIIDTTLGQVKHDKLAFDDQIHTFALRPMKNVPSKKFSFTCGASDDSNSAKYSTSADSMLVCAVLRGREKRDDYVLIVFEKEKGEYVERRELRVNNQNQTFSHHEQIETVVFSGDGKVLASAGNDGIVRFWDPVKGPLRLEDGRTLKLKDIGSQTIRGVHFRPIKHSNAGATQHYEVVFNTLESASVYSIVKLQDGSWRSVLLNNIDNCAPLLHTGCTFNADGTFLLVRGSDKRSAMVFDTGAKGGHLDVVNPRCTFKCGKKVTALSWLSDSSSVVMFDDEANGYVWSAEGEGAIASALSHFSITGHGVKKDPVTAAARPKLFEEEQADTSGANRPADDSQHNGSWQRHEKAVGDASRCVVDAAIARTGRFMVTLHGDTLRKSTGGTEVRLWDLQPEAPHVTYPLGEHNRQAAPLAISAAPVTSMSEGLVAIAGGYGKVLLWDVHKPSCPPSIIFNGEGNGEVSHEVDLDDEENSLYAIAWSFCGSRLAVSGSNEKVLLWQNPTMDSLSPPIVLDEARMFNGIEGVNALAWSKRQEGTHQYLVAASSGKDPKLIVWKVTDSSATRMTFGPNGEELGLDVKHLMMDDNISSLSSVTPRETLEAENLMLSYLRLECAEFSPPGYQGNEILLVGGETGLWSWDVTKWESGDMGAGFCRSADAQASWVQQVKFSKNGSLVAIAAEGQGVGVITTDDWQCLWENWSEEVDQRRSTTPWSEAGSPHHGVNKNYKAAAKWKTPKSIKVARRPAKGTPKQMSIRKQETLTSGLLKVNTNIEDIEPLDIAWGPIDQTLIVGGELRGNQGIHILDASNGNPFCTILAPRVHSIALALACKGPDLFDYTGIIGVHSLRGNSTFVSVWTPHAQSGVTPDWMHYVMLRTNTIFPEKSVIKHYPELQYRVDYTGRSIMMHALEHMAKPTLLRNMMATMKQCEDIVEEIVEIAQTDGYSITVCNSNSTFQDQYGHSEAINMTMNRSNTNFNVTIAICSALSYRKFRHSSRSHYIFWPLIQAMVTQYPAMLVTYLQDGMAPLGKFQWPVPALVGVNLIAAYHREVQETSTYSMWLYLVQRTMLVTKMGIMLMVRHWISGDGNGLDDIPHLTLGHHSVMSSVDVISRAIPRIKPAAPKSDMAAGHTCNIAYYKQLPSVLRFWRKTILNPLLRMFNLAIQSLSKDTMDTSSQHTIPMQAFCFQLPGIGAPPARAKYSVLESMGFIKQASPEPGDFLRLLLYNPRVPLSVFGSYGVIAATELRWQTYGLDCLVWELLVHALLVFWFWWFSSYLPDILRKKDRVPCESDKGMMTACAFIALIWLRKTYKSMLSLLRLGPRRYFVSTWKILDIATQILFVFVAYYFAIICDDNVGKDSVSAITNVAALTNVLIWVQFFYFLLGFEATGPLVRMVIQIAVDMKYFLMLMFAIGMGFGNAFRLLFYTHHRGRGSELIPDSDNDWYEPVNLSVTMVALALGDFDRHDFRYTSEPVLANILFVTYILIMTVVLLNLLIAIMGDSYDRVKDKEVLEFLRGKVRLLIEMESQMEGYDLARWAKRSNRFVHFLVPAEEVQENETQEWLGRLKETEKKVRAIVEQSNAKVQRTIANIDHKVTALQMKSSMMKRNLVRMSQNDVDSTPQEMPLNLNRGSRLEPAEPRADE